MVALGPDPFAKILFPLFKSRKNISDESWSVGSKESCSWRYVGVVGDGIEIRATLLILLLSIYFNFAFDIEQNIQAAQNDWLMPKMKINKQKKNKKR